MVAGVDHWIRAADAAILLVALGTIGVRLLRESRVTAAPASVTDLSMPRPAHP